MALIYSLSIYLYLWITIYSLLNNQQSHSLSDIGKRLQTTKLLNIKKLSKPHIYSALHRSISLLLLVFFSQLLPWCDPLWLYGDVDSVELINFVLELFNFFFVILRESRQDSFLLPKFFLDLMGIELFSSHHGC